MLAALASSPQGHPLLPGREEVSCWRGQRATVSSHRQKQKVLQEISPCLKAAVCPYDAKTETHGHSLLQIKEGGAERHYRTDSSLSGSCSPQRVGVEGKQNYLIFVPRLCFKWNPILGDHDGFYRQADLDIRVFLSKVTEWVSARPGIALRTSMAVWSWRQQALLCVLPQPRRPAQALVSAQSVPWISVIKHNTSWMLFPLEKS